MATNALILRAAGTNCDEETEHAFRLVSAETERLHVNRVAERPDVLEAAQIVVIPGGFTYGDDVAAGAVLANELTTRLAEPLHRFVERGGLVLGICNGFQVLVKTGLLPGWDGDTTALTLTDNLSGKFEGRWVTIRPGSTRCVYTSGMDGPICLPVAHAEGRLTASSEGVLDRLESQEQVAFRYVGSDGGPAGYPDNPNGADRDIAGICDPSGRVLGLMPHPERHVHPTHHPQWTRREPSAEGDGLQIFRNALNAAQASG